MMFDRADIFGVPGRLAHRRASSSTRACRRRAPICFRWFSLTCGRLSATFNMPECRWRTR
ncbi:hypothetical protein KCP73_11025 [Salmonella enterica subsp. enterica]|nr:hypothetical protein KCP73_11025 [Salmonella enterica subsp. enterica]